MDGYDSCTVIDDAAGWAQIVGHGYGIDFSQPGKELRMRQEFARTPVFLEEVFQGMNGRTGGIMGREVGRHLDSERGIS